MPSRPSPIRNPQSAIRNSGTLISNPGRFAHLKAVPPSRGERDSLRAAGAAVAEGLDRRRPLTEGEVIEAGQATLARAGLPEAYLAFAMIAVHNAFWLDQFRAVPFTRRLLLLPRCLKYIRPADGNPSREGHLDHLSLLGIRTRARQLGYRTLVADGTPIVVQSLAQDGMDAVLGVACLDSLESAFQKVRQLGVPSVAVPLLTGNCRDTATDLDQVMALVEASQGRGFPATRSFLPVLRVAHQLFEEEDLSQILERSPVEEDGASSLLLADTPRLAREWLRRGGKRLRPFVTLAGYRALAATGDDLPDAVRRAAVAIEAFHKASLVHDDIEDDDATRYGLPTLHRQVGVGAAINVGDYLLGLGYRLIASVGQAPPAGRGPSAGEGPAGQAHAAALVRVLSDAHVRLARGQGAELAWRRTGTGGPAGTAAAAPAGAPRLSLADVLRIYALKTAPAFEAALASGMILAGAFDPYADLVRQFCRYIGVGFQVMNDLRDWEADLLHRRPTVLPLLVPGGGPEQPSDDAGVVHRFFESHGVFDTARRLVGRFRGRATALATRTTPPTPPGLSDLLVFLTETILSDPGDPSRPGCRRVPPVPPPNLTTEGTEMKKRKD